MRVSRLILISFVLGVILIIGIAAQSLPSARAEKVGMLSGHLDRISDVIDEAISNKEFPGAVLVVGRHGKIVLRKAYGQSQWVPESRTMDVDMIFDVASMTKPIATATSLMILVEQGRLNLWDKVIEYIPDFQPFQQGSEGSSENASIWHLLTHTSGLPPYADVNKIKTLYGSPCPRASLIDHIGKLPKTDPPGKVFHYSCLGYITLAYLIEKITGMDIAEFSSEHIFDPLGMKHTFFLPPETLYDLCVPTEVIEGKPLIGIVHDPLARLQGGISGNAGLFSSADDLAVFAQMMLNKGSFQGVRILSPLAVAKMTAIYLRAEFSGRGLGWDLDSAYATNQGDLFGENSYGHTGYTGTSIWIDPDTQTFVIFLTNRVHPNDRGKILSIRSKIANIVAASIIE
ncbi:MAG: serine hydrolase [Candidatus Aminicenantes bacterium]|nr:serine hydrolase [Candidatus Aminicenantes bacterium]